MVFYIKAKADFETITYGHVFDYELKHSIYDTISTVVIPTPKEQIKQGDYIVFDGQPYIGIINSVSVDKGQTTLNCLQIISLFDRQLYAFYEEQQSTSIEQTFAGVANTMLQDGHNFAIEVYDEAFSLLYFYANAITTTPGIVTMSPDGFIANLKTWCNNLRRVSDIYSIFSWSNSAIRCNVQKINKPYKNIDVSNPRYDVTEEITSDIGVSKATVLYFPDEQPSWTSTFGCKEYYLLNNGTITSTYTTVNRAEGTYVMERANSQDEMDSVGINAIRKSQYSHKVAFSCPKDEGFELYDKINIRLSDGTIKQSYISGITERMNSDFVDVECGELQTKYPYLKRS